MIKWFLFKIQFFYVRKKLFISNFKRCFSVKRQIYVQTVKQDVFTNLLLRARAFIVCYQAVKGASNTFAVPQVRTGDTVFTLHELFMTLSSTSAGKLLSITKQFQI